MFNLFKRMRRAPEPAQSTRPIAKDPIQPPDVPTIDGHNSAPETKLTAASWPVPDQKSEFLLLGGGCCG